MRKVGRQPIQPANGVAPPQPVGIPQARAAIQRGKYGADSPDAMPCDEIDLHTGFGQRAEHPRVVRPVRAGPGKDDGRAELQANRYGDPGRVGSRAMASPVGRWPRAGAPAVIPGRGW